MDKKQAERLRAEAEAQLKLLAEVENIAQADFYSYRYFASEGFLPGYNFPRLPISAYIPGRRTKQRDEFLSRPRFLAISEFGPRSIVYHEGSRYIINKVILPVSEDHVHGNVHTGRAKLCDTCGYLHPLNGEAGVDLCERCGTLLGAPLHSLFKMQNVSARRRDKINSDEEERVRLGYELQTGVRFPEHIGRPSFRTATITVNGEPIFRLTYGQAATLWRINLGWTRRQEKNQFGFVLDTERGYWAKDTITTEDPEDPVSVRTTRVIPYVEDTRNCLLIEPVVRHELRVMASLQAALKVAIQVSFQLEDNELAAEPLPNDKQRHLLLLYESTEGGAGVLRRLLDDPQAMAHVARAALDICHFDPVTGADQHHAPGAKEACEAACYDCLMSYYNQREHALLDRQLVRELLLHLTRAHTMSSPTPEPRATHLEHLLRQNAPDTYAISDVRSAADLTVAAKMVDRHPIFGNLAAGPPVRHYQAELHMGNDRGRFTTDRAGFPVYEGRMISHFDHRAKTYDSGHGNSSVWIERPFGDPEKAIVPQWRVVLADIPRKLGDRCGRYRLGFRDVAQPRDVRSFIATLIPPGVICGHKVPTIIFEQEYEWAYLPWLAVANSFVMDWMVRSKLSSPSMTYSLVDSLPFPRPKLDEPWVQRVAPLVLCLVCTAPEMTTYWNVMARHGLCGAVPDGTIPPEALVTDAEREIARSELDAIVARDVYGLTRRELSDVLETFPVVKSRDEKAHGEYRTKRLIYEAWGQIC